MCSISFSRPLAPVQRIADDVSPSLAKSGAAPATADTSLHFSSNIAIQRPFRSRYSHQPYDRSSSPAASASTSSLLAEPSAAPKRSFSEVTPSSGSTPPAIPSAFSVSFASTSTGMHSFDSQRFSSSSSSSSATRTRYLREQQEAGGLRRRNLPSTAEGGVNEGERERAKRRRAGTLELRPRDEPPPISPSSPRSPRMRDAQEDEDGWNWPSEERDRERRATSTSFQLAPVVGVGSTSSVSRRITRTESNESSRRNLLESLPSPPLLPIPFAELPSTRDLPHPSAQVERPVIGFNRPTPSPASPPSSGSSSFSFLLTNLRSRHADRPRLARNALGAISPPEEVERRLWGSLDDEEEGRRRMRGPTERANERWRMGQLPPAEEPTTSTTTTRRRRPAPTSLFNPLPGSAAEGLGQPLRPSALQPSLESGGPVHDLSLPLPFPSTSDRIRIARPTPLVRPPTQAQNPLMPESDSEEEQETGDESREAAQSARAWREMHRDITAGVRTVGGGDEGQMPQRVSALSSRERRGLTSSEPQQPPTSRLFRRHQQLPRPTTALNDSPPSPPSPPVRERSSIAEALALFRATTSSSSDESTLRRRRSPATLASPVEPQEETTPATERHAARTERLQSLRRERNLVRALLGGVVPPVEQEQEEHQQPRSPGGRTRGLSEFFRGMGGVGGRFVAAWDEDFAGFYRRDSAALDPRNYLVGLLSLSLARLGRKLTSVRILTGRRRIRLILRRSPAPLRAVGRR